MRIALALMAVLTLAACSKADNSKVTQANADLKAAGAATTDAAGNLPSAATHEIKAADATAVEKPGAAQQAAGASYAAKASLGRWCAKPSNVRATWQLIEIVSAPTTRALTTAGDGSRLVEVLSRRSAEGTGTRFAIKGSITGDFYVVQDARTDLQVGDKDGLIYTARPLKPAQPPTDCLPSGTDRPADSTDIPRAIKSSDANTEAFYKALCNTAAGPPPESVQDTCHKLGY